MNKKLCNCGHFDELAGETFYKEKVLKNDSRRTSMNLSMNLKINYAEMARKILRKF